MITTFRVLRLAGLALAISAGPAFAASHACGLLSPRYEPKSPARAAEAPARFKGGVRLILPVAAPCPRRASALDV